MDSMPICPACGAETNEFFMDENHNIVGCTDCIRRIDAWEYTREEDLSARIDRGYDAYLERLHGF